MTGTISVSDRALGWSLSLGDLKDQDRERCMGFANACMCAACRAYGDMTVRQREDREREARLAQPWEPRPPRIAA